MDIFFLCFLCYYYDVFFFYTTILTEKQRDNLWTSETKNDTTTQNGKKAAIPNSSFQSEEQKYWNSLSDEWLKALKGNAKLTTPIQKITKEELDKIYKLTFHNKIFYNIFRHINSCLLN